MASYSIYDKNGNLRYEASSVKFTSTFMQVAALTVTVKSALPIEFSVGDYIDYGYDGMRYTLRDTPTPKKVARYDTVTVGGSQVKKGLYGEAFQYELVFKGPLWELENCPFKDYVLNDNDGHFTSLPDVSTYERPSGIINRIKANVLRFSDSETASVIGAWDFYSDWFVGEDDREPLDFSLSNASCLDALNEVFNKWQLSYRVVKVNGKNAIRVNDISTHSVESSLFKYGKGQGLKALRKSIQNGDSIATRIYAYGSTVNLPSRYYNKVQYDGVNIVGDNMYIPNLMLPISEWKMTKWYKWVNGGVMLYTLMSIPAQFDLAYQIPCVGGIGLTITAGSAASITVGGVVYTANGNADFPDVTKAYYEYEDALGQKPFIEKFGVRPATIYFDGSDNRPDIHPSIKGVTIGHLRGALDDEDPYYPSETIYPSSTERIDEIKEGSFVFDNGDKDSTRYLEDIVAVEEEQRTVTKTIKFITKSDLTAGIPVALDDMFTGTLEHDGKLYIKSKPVLVQFNASQSLEGLSIKNSYYEIYNNEERVFAGEVLQRPREAGSLTQWFLIDSTPNGVRVSAGSISIRCVVTFGGRENESYEITLSNLRLQSVEYLTKPLLDVNFFEVKLKDLGFDIIQYAGTEGVQISMLDGFCGGYTFDVMASGTAYDAVTQTWTLRCQRISDGTLNLYYPNSNAQIKAGDHFVLLGIDMPDIYVRFAEQKLLEAVLKESPWEEQYIIEPEIDNIQMARSPQALSAGMWMQVYDKDLDLNDGNNSVYILIDSLTIDDGGSDIPKFSVTLRNDKPLNALGVLSGRVDGNTSDIESAKRSSTIKSVGTESEPTSDVTWATLTGKPDWIGDTKPEYTLAELTGDTTHRVVTDAQITAWNNTAQYAHEHSNKTTVLDKLKWDATNNAVYIGDANNPINFYVYGEITAGGVGSDTPTPGATTLGGLLNVTDSADDIQSTDKILVRLADASGANSWTLADLSDISGTVVGVKMNGVVKNPGTDKIVDLGTVLTEHQSLAGYQPLIDASHKLAYSLISGTPDLSDMATKTWVAGGLEIIATALETHTEDTDIHITTAEREGWNAKYSKPSTGIPATDLATAVQTSLGKADSAYQKPSTGIPYADLASGVKGSLDKADSALQSHQTIYALTVQKNGTTVDTYTPNSAAKTINIPDVASAQTLSDLKTWIESMFEKDTTSVSGQTLIKAKFSLYSEGEITAGGVGSGGGGGGGIIQSVYGYTDLGGTYSDSDKTNTFNAYTTARLAQRITALENAPAGGVTSFNSRTGAVVLTLADVEGVLNLAPIENAIKSLQSQIDSVSARDGFDELITTSLFADTLVGTNIYGALHGNADSATNADTLDGQHGSYYATVSALTVHTTNTSNPHSVTKDQIGLGNVENKSSATIRGELTASNVTTALGATYVQNANYASSAGNADTVDGEHSSAFAHIGAHNNLMASGNEFTFASSGFSGAIYLNYRTAGGTNGNITDYIFSNGAGGTLTNLSTLITRSGHGETAYNDLTTVSQALQSLQSQIDGVATKDGYDELNATCLFADMITAGNVYGSLRGNADTATNATNATYATYDSAGENISNGFSVVTQSLQSLQSQIDSVASRDFSELAETLMSLKMWIEDMFEKTSSGIHTKYNFSSSGEITAGA